MRAMGKIASCEISFVPVGTEEYLSKINQVLKIIKGSSLENTVGYLSTVVRGEKDRVLALITDIYQTMDGVCDFTMDIKLSNLCGCKQ
ncbi:YkoF family thiamine/hydroxymethylpyrimidine-binding protein [Chloroflexota bacterium]